MANEMVTVCLRPDSHHDLRAAIETALAPFDMNGDHQPYRGEWDQWWLGRAGEEFDVLPGHEGDSRVVRAPLDSRGNPVTGLSDSATEARAVCSTSRACAPAPRNWPRRSTLVSPVRPRIG
ncbi:hypothetical protein [Streptomyces lushanensis]|uniref:hypothetical protein n=1 Tax=Streptomyces lushanensis TaxID=1434255 RepID=UPI00114CBA5D|nr:hypothetical protein [Streptomyces lushanensis]